MLMGAGVSTVLVLGILNSWASYSEAAITAVSPAFGGSEDSHRLDHLGIQRHLLDTSSSLAYRKVRPSQISSSTLRA